MSDIYLVKISNVDENNIAETIEGLIKRLSSEEKENQIKEEERSKEDQNNNVNRNIKRALRDNAEWRGDRPDYNIDEATRAILSRLRKNLNTNAASNNKEEDKKEKNTKTESNNDYVSKKYGFIFRY